MASEVIKLPVTGAPLSPTFNGTPQELFEAMLERMRVVFPTSQTSFVISDTEPSTNQGPWLKGGTQWYVWSEADKRYVPVDTSPSWPVIISSTAPANGATPLWVKFKGTRPLGVYLWLNDAWQLLSPARNSGPTADRPDDPEDLERYYDTEIKTDLIYSGGWKTVAGSPGDVKFVKYATLEQALQFNPGWSELGTAFGDDAVRGRAIVAAHQDAGATPATVLPAGTGITVRAQGDKFGEETHTLTQAELPDYQLPVSHDFQPVTLDSAEGQAFASGGAGARKHLTVSSGGSDTPHNNIQPTLALWALVKNA